jgi:GTP cyclohydrolase I
MNASERMFLVDVQASQDARNVAIEHVGVRGLRYPLPIQGRQGTQHTVVEAEMTVALDPSVKGTHMSRFVETLEAWDSAVGPADLVQRLNGMLERLDAAAGRIALRFPYFIRKRAPVSGVESMLDYQAGMRAEVRPGEPARLGLTLTAPVTSLCPCSKEISEYGAHNQRSHVTLDVELIEPGALDFESLAEIAEAAASCEIYGLLKRPDEKYVTERAYDNPKFVEDLVRDLALALENHPAIRRYMVEVENFESIHNHSAYARLTGGRDAVSRVTDARA